MDAGNWITIGLFGIQALVLLPLGLWVKTLVQSMAEAEQGRRHETAKGIASQIKAAMDHTDTRADALKESMDKEVAALNKRVDQHERSQDVINQRLIERIDEIHAEAKEAKESVQDLNARTIREVGDLRLYFADQLTKFLADCRRGAVPVLSGPTQIETARRKEGS
jgi:hypothetical protein